MKTMLFHLFLVFFKIGMLAFGGGYSTVPFIQKEIVETNQWLTEQEFLDIIPTAEMTPGSLSINAATYVGYKLEGFWGAIVSTLGIVLPSFIAVAIVTALINSHPNDLLIERGLKGLKPAVVVLILSAAVILGEDSLLSVSDFLIFSLVFLLSWQTDINPIVLIVLSGFVGIIL